MKGIASFAAVAVVSLVACAGAAAQLVISEFRYRGPNGANDEFVEIANVSGSPFVVSSPSGFAVVASDGTARFIIPNGTTIPAGGHYLGCNTVSYSLVGYATCNATYTTDIPDNAGIALFNNGAGGASFSLANRLDAVGSAGEANTIYKEGTGLPNLTAFSYDYTWYRDTCGKGGSIIAPGPCPQAGAPKDTNNNAADFIYVNTTGSSSGAGQILGAPGPQNLAAPVSTGGLTIAPLDSCVADTAAPNAVRDLVSDPPNNSVFGTRDIRRTVTNTTAAPLTQLRFRVIDITTFPAPTGTADLRPRTSIDALVTVDRPPCGSGTALTTVRGTTLQQPPTQPNGGGFNSSLAVSLPGGSLAVGASVDVRFLLGLQQNGTERISICAEAVPAGGGCFLWTTEQPTAVAFASASAARTSRGVLVRWRTASERDVLGFNVHRAVMDRRIRLNGRLVPAKGGGSYSFRDRRAPSGKRLRYWIEVVNVDGSRDWRATAPLAAR